MKQLNFTLLLVLNSFSMLGQNAEIAGAVIVDSIDVSSGLIKNVADPISAQDAASKAYLDSMVLELKLMADQKVEDIEGNDYKTIIIGDQLWLSENLRSTQYNDGTPIQLVEDQSEWDTITTPAYCYYDNSSTEYAVPYGILYNYYVVADTNSLNVCPTGWHIPTDAEWTTLTTYLGGELIAGGKLKETGTFYWSSPNTGATNESNFAALPGGNRNAFDPFFEIGETGRWWSTTELDASNVWYRGLSSYSNEVDRFTNQKDAASSLRCLRD